MALEKFKDRLSAAAFIRLPRIKDVVGSRVAMIQVARNRKARYAKKIDRYLGFNYYIPQVFQDKYIVSLMNRPYYNGNNSGHLNAIEELAHIADIVKYTNTAREYAEEYGLPTKILMNNEIEESLYVL